MKNYDLNYEYNIKLLIFSQWFSIKYNIQYIQVTNYIQQCKLTELHNSQCFILLLSSFGSCYQSNIIIAGFKAGRAGFRCSGWKTSRHTMKEKSSIVKL